MMQILMLVILLCGCGSKPDTDDFDLDGTFRVDSRLDPNGSFAKAEPQKILAYYLRKLGATVVDPVYGATNDTIFVAEGFDCPAGRVGYVNSLYPSTIFICQAARGDPHAFFSMLPHELGHLLGAAHTPCEKHGIMAPLTNCTPIEIEWTPEDIVEICSNGRTVGGVCGRKQPRKTSF